MLQKSAKRGDAYRAEIKGLQALLAPPRKPAALQAAINGHRTARDKRAALDQELREAIKTFRDDPNSAPARQKVESLTKVREGLHTAAQDCQRELARYRKEYQPTFDGAVIPPALALRALASELVDLLDDGLKVLVDAERAAQNEGLDVPRPLAGASAILQQVYALRRMLS
jgi:hypothetical protein